MKTSGLFVLVVLGFLGIAGPLRAMSDQESGAAVASSELQRVPEPQDPWAIVQTSPGVQTGRFSAGGNESGYSSAGGVGTMVIDGKVWTFEICHFSFGDSTAFSDSEAFEELQVTTGGSDATQEPPP